MFFCRQMLSALLTRLFSRQAARVVALALFFSLMMGLSATAVHAQPTAPVVEAGCDSAVWETMRLRADSRRMRDILYAYAVFRETGSAIANSCLADAMGLSGRLGALFSDLPDFKLQAYSTAVFGFLDMDVPTPEQLIAHNAAELYNQFVSLGGGIHGQLSTLADSYNSIVGASIGGYFHPRIPGIPGLGGIDANFGGSLASGFQANLGFDFRPSDIVAGIGSDVYSVVNESLRDLVDDLMEVTGLNAVLHGVSGVLGVISAIFEPLANAFNIVGGAIDAVMDILEGAESFFKFAGAFFSLVDSALNFKISVKATGAIDGAATALGGFLQVDLRFLSDTIALMSSIAGTLGDLVDVMNDALELFHDLRNLLNELANLKADFRLGVEGVLNYYIEGVMGLVGGFISSVVTSMSYFDQSFSIGAILDPILPAADIGEFSLPSFPIPPDLDLSAFVNLDGAGDFAIGQLSDILGGVDVGGIVDGINSAVGPDSDFMALVNFAESACNLMSAVWEMGIEGFPFPEFQLPELEFDASISIEANAEAGAGSGPAEVDRGDRTRGANCARSDGTGGGGPISFGGFADACESVSGVDNRTPVEVCEDRVAERFRQSRQTAADVQERNDGNRSCAAL